LTESYRNFIMMCHVVSFDLPLTRPSLSFGAELLTIMLFDVKALVLKQ
jgi:hypothetical protein